jgi:hypothetical protein
MQFPIILNLTGFAISSKEETPLFINSAQIVALSPHGGDGSVIKLTDGIDYYVKEDCAEIFDMIEARTRKLIGYQARELALNLDIRGWLERFKLSVR